MKNLFQKIKGLQLETEVIPTNKPECFEVARHCVGQLLKCMEDSLNPQTLVTLNTDCIGLRKVIESFMHEHCVIIQQEEKFPDVPKAK